MSLNKCILMGRLTKDVDLRFTPSGVAVASFTIAVDRDFKDRQTGEKQVDFVDIVAWRNTGEFASKYFSKGRMAVVEGRLQFRGWTDKDGNSRRNAEIVADNIYFGDSKKNDAAESNPGFGSLPHNQQAAELPNENEGQFTDLSDNEDELPF